MAWTLITTNMGLDAVLNMNTQTEQKCEPMNQLNSKKYMQDISEFGLGGLFLS